MRGVIDLSFFMCLVMFAVDILAYYIFFYYFC